MTYNPHSWPIRDLSGNLLDFGTVKKVLEWNPTLDTTLPAWLTASSTPTIQTVTDGDPGIILDTPLGTNAQVRLLFSGAIPMDNVNAIMIEATSIRASVGELYGSVELGLLHNAANGSSGNIGPWASVRSDAKTPAQMKYDDASYTVAYSPNAPDHGGNQFEGVHLCLLWDKAHQQAYLMDQDNVVGIADGEGANALVAGQTIRPSIAVRSSVAASYHIAGIKITMWYD